MLSVFEKLIIKISKHYTLTGIENSDMLQEGWLCVLSNRAKWEGLDATNAKCLMTPFIRRAMRDYCIANQRIIKMAKTKKQIKAVNNILSYVSCLDELTPAAILQISEDINVEPRDVRIAAEFVFESDGPLTAEGKATLTYGDCELPESSSLEMISERVLKLSALDVAIDTLEKNEKEIVKSRWFSDKKESFKLLSERLNISISGIAYIESKAAIKIREEITTYIEI